VVALRAERDELVREGQRTRDAWAETENALRAELADCMLVYEAALDREAGLSDALEDANVSASGYRADRDRERAAREAAERERDEARPRLAEDYFQRAVAAEAEAKRYRAALETIERDDEVEFPVKGWQAQAARAALGSAAAADTTEDTA